MEFDEQTIVRTRLNIAPLIDIVFLLLIFFMLSSHFVDQQGIEVALPKAVTAKDHRDCAIVITVRKDNSIFFNSKSIEVNNLQSLLEDKIRDSSEKQVIIKADKDIHFGLAVKIIDIVRKSNAEGLVISTKNDGN